MLSKVEEIFKMLDKPNIIEYIKVWNSIEYDNPEYDISASFNYFKSG